MRTFFKGLAWVLGFFSLLGLAAGAGGLYLLQRSQQDLPDYRQLADYRPPQVTRIHAGDGRLMAEYAREKRVFVPIEAMPRRLIQAFLAAEDKNFYHHPGVDFVSIAAAVLTNIQRLRHDLRPVGASTITQQVAKNFLLTNEVSLERKIKEALLAFRIERAFTKDQILELYLNEIYLGLGSYGVAAAALNYFNKSLDELTTGEAAFLAGLPKAPSRYHPVRAPGEARGRRDWVIARMLENGVISREEAAEARAEPLLVRRRAPTEVVSAEFFTEEVRRELAGRYGEEVLYEDGLSIRTTLEPALQEVAEKALRDGLVAYDRRHGWRGPVDRIDPGAGWEDALAAASAVPPAPGWRLAVVRATDAAAATLGFADGGSGTLPLAEMTWARPALENQEVGPEPEAPGDVVGPGDVVWVEPLPPAGEAGDEAAAADGAAAPTRYALRQLPAVQGAAIALNPHTGRVLAMVGGFDPARSQFNRATQALRQPGSALKPFVYLAALEDGFTPSSIILDAPIVLDQGPGLGKWKPANYSNRFYGPSTLRRGVEKSRNVMTVRLAQEVGMERIVDLARRLGIGRGMSRNLSSALGAHEVDLMHLTTAYAMLVNGGKRIEPALIERIQDKHGQTVQRRDDRPCPDCRNVLWQDQPTPELVDDRPQVVDPARAYQMVNILNGVVERGTGVRARAIGKPIAGKTGTSNESRDAWFIGFTPDLVVGVYVGFDQPKSLGARETGASAALPVFVDIMEAALEGEPATPFRVPPGVRLVRVEVETGLLPDGSGAPTLLEAFIPGTEPTRTDAGGPRLVQSPGDAGAGGRSNGRSNGLGGPALPAPGGLY
ncbi:MAG TPA: penicillin-binding protein 1A [Geminicoccaceae bacterium]